MSTPQEGLRPVAEDAPVFVISVAAELAGMHAQTLRQYDRRGLVSPGRTAGGGRRETPRDVALLREVQRLSQEDGVNLAGIKRIIELESQVEALRARVQELLEEVQIAESRRIAAEAAVSATYGRGADAEEAFRQLERELGFLLRRARALQARVAAQLHPDLEPAALGLLALLQDEGPLRASDLVVRLGLDKSTVSRQVNSLVDLGLVDRAADPVDGRAQVLTPSAEGAERLADVRAARRSYLR